MAVSSFLSCTFVDRWSCSTHQHGSDCHVARTNMAVIVPSNSIICECSQLVHCMSSQLDARLERLPAMFAFFLSVIALLAACLLLHYSTSFYCFPFSFSPRCSFQSDIEIYHIGFDCVVVAILDTIPFVQ
jgi:hypothetical protein